MGVRDFRDSSGRRWRAWDVAPDELNARTRDEDFLAQLYYTGWIVFETETGDSKRRLYPIPKGWEELPDPELEVLLAKAEIVPPRKLHSERKDHGPAAARAMERTRDLVERAIDTQANAPELSRDETPDVTDLSAVRSFRYPGGRIWAVRAVLHPEDGGPPVLRFSSGGRTFDILDWPKDWVDYSDAELIALLRSGAPRPRAHVTQPDTPQRRWNDSITE